MAVLLVDLFLIVLLVVALVVGLQRGLVASLGTLLGLAAGGVAAWWLAPVINDAWPWQDWRPLVVIVASFLLLVLGGTIGGAVGGVIRRGVDRVKLRVIDRLLGGVVSVVVAALALSLVGQSVANTGAPVLGPAVASSRVMTIINGVIPAPVSQTLGEWRSFVTDDGLPRLGGLVTPEVTPGTATPIPQEDPELELASASVLRVSGTAFACGTSSTGSGFVVAPDRVVTNAHVVAGVDTPVVQPNGGTAVEGRVVYFDPIDDLAVIAVDGLGVAPLGLSGPLTAGSAAQVQGYPLGGPWTPTRAEVLSVGTVPVPDIYDDTANPREIYQLFAEVRPGNSGGPLLTGDGEVAGVVFARADGDDTRGFAMTNAELEPVAAGAAGLSDRVSTGDCLG
ncbi:MarP family serine protease [Microbacterium invictum]|uniref:MarP family serine protease n=1 Tax=Microbacterium invictum TaxID=515415 RepID=A0ABZ0VFT2_9MICO|nr:MarP family serine protease [Microbacterium invictum]WQB71778.1 MarP family serine protease [Microbacterium invictum]